MSDPLAPTGVVLDDPLARALMYMAVREGLLPGDPLLGDGYVAHLLDTPPTDDIAAYALEQIVIGGRILVPFWLPREWIECLPDIGPIVPLDPPLAGIRAGVVPGEIVLGMMAARGVRWSVEEYNERLERFRAAFRRWDEIAPGIEPGRAQITDMVTRAVGRARSPFSEDQLDALNAVGAAEQEMALAVRCVRDYEAVVAAALDHAALSAVPLGADLRGRSTRLDLDDNETRVELLRVTCRELQRVPVASTLRQTLKIAASPEAEALRAKLSEWSNALRAHDSEGTSVAISEVAKARAHLQTAKTFSTAATYAAYFGVPASVASALVIGPEMAALGISVAVVGAIGVGAEKLIDRVNRWAMYARS